ncbi:hypothetical protein HX775_05445 [Serratia proteamaculans]|uniref:hypothetical protein n=1 Tax=Serratia proteamaculans TaxID=28151 RepID=UPI0015A01332|nr:hypothetical protein [Serratia proteamaculans]NWA71363.1 hypothetical protein [Serratia proteamaculans]
MSFDKVLIELVKTFENSSQSMGSIRYSSVEVPSSKIALRISGQIEHFYKHIIMEKKPTLGGDFSMQFFEPEKLKDALVGWRWIGPQGIEDPSWSKDYIIFADRNGDALFCDVSDDKCPVYGSIQKVNYQLSLSLCDFINAINKSIDIEKNEFNNETTDEDFNHLPDYLAAIDKELVNIIPRQLADNFKYFYFG